MTSADLQPGGSGAGSTVDRFKALLAVHTGNTALFPDYCASCQQMRPCDAQELAQEVMQLRADLEAARSERDTWRAAQEECHELHLLAEGQLAQARARIEVLGRVDEAAREYSYNGHVPPCRVEYRHCTCGYTDLLNALDAAQAAQQPQHASETTAALGDLQSPGPREDAPEH